MQHEVICAQLKATAEMQKGLQDRVSALETRIDTKDPEIKKDFDDLAAQVRLNKVTLEDRLAAFEHDIG
eukprot:12930511-Prorocentrum_lima.AAC.1